MNTYTTIPTFMVLFLARLKGIPKTLYEAAALDGASPWVTFSRIRPGWGWAAGVRPLGRGAERPGLEGLPRFHEPP